MMMPWGCALLTAYLVGSIPTAYLMVKRLKGTDIRSIGSGNVGATNVTRAAGFKAGALVFLLDAAKGWLAATWVAGQWSPPSTIAPLACGVAAIVGHIAPVFLGFRGGKGVATMIGVLIGAMPAVAGICLLIWLACFLAWRYVSLASLIALSAVPLAQWVLRQPFSHIAIGLALVALVVFTHRANIARLRAGTEHRWTKNSTKHSAPSTK